MSASIFISHSSRDAGAARDIVQALEKRGLSCWMAGRDVHPGENFMSAIVQAIRSARVMVLVFSDNANGSQEIAKELALASQYQLVVMPVRVEDVVPNDALAYALATSQWTDLFRDWDVAIDRLGSRMVALLGVGAPVAASVVEPRSMALPGIDVAAPAAPPAVHLGEPVMSASDPQASQARTVSPRSGGAHVIGVLLIVQGLVRLLRTMDGISTVLNGDPALLVPVILVPLILGAAAIVTGALVYRRASNVRVANIILIAICLAYQVYSIFGGLSATGSLPASYWGFTLAYLAVFVAALVHLLPRREPALT